MRPAGGLLLLALASTPAEAAIVVDGRLDEPEWQQAQRFSDFKTTDPNTQAEPELATTVLVHSGPDALYVGFVCDQPPSVERVRARGQRDQFIAGDRVNVMLDFDGSGSTGYEFSAFLGGEKQDAIISRQVNYNYDWDPDWDYAASETAEQWFIEYRIPWNVAPMGATVDGKRTLGVFFSRVVVASGKRYSLPANAFARATFVADMRKIQVTAHDPARLDVYPYISHTRDVLREEHDTRAGIDLFWKPNGRHQLTLTANPDFGHVESDQLVVNFSAIPRFFPDKRPFFTENLGLFNTEFNVLYTRRIGAAPDAGTEGVSDILGAAKYTGTSGALAYGLIAAIEDDAAMAEGRDFYVGRTRWQASKDFSIGWMGTHVERPELERTADVNALDFNWSLAPGMSLGGQGLVTEVDDEDEQPYLNPNGTGSGGALHFRYAPGGRFEHWTLLTTKNRNFNINDAGFMDRPSEHLLETETTVFWRDWAPESAIQEQKLRVYGYDHYNDRGDRLQAYLFGHYTVIRKDTRQMGLKYQGSGIGGVDDLLTRGNGNVQTPIGHRIDAFYTMRQSGLFRGYTQVGCGQSNFENGCNGFHVFYMEPGFYPHDTFSMTGVFEIYDFVDDMQWRPLNDDPADSRIATFRYEQEYVALNLNWFPVLHHEVRAKFQWIAGSGDFLHAYRPNAEANLVEVNEPVDDFSFSITGIQVRYRWNFAPESDLFLVYSRGGFDSLVETERNLDSSFRRGLAEETDSQFLMKLRYRFAVLG
jgi:hypothetical protein